MTTEFRMQSFLENNSEESQSKLVFGTVFKGRNDYNSSRAKRLSSPTPQDVVISTLKRTKLESKQ